MSLAERLREAEVQHLHRAVGPQLDVRGLQIAMNDALLVRGFERLGNLPRDRQRVVERNRSLERCARRASAVDELHARARCMPSRFLEAVDRGDVRMIQRREHLRFALEPREPIRIGRERLRQDLERDVAIQPRVAGAIHLAHAARADELRRLRTRRGGRLL